MYFFDKTTWRKSWNHPPGSPLVTNLTKWIFQSLCWDFQCIFVVKPLKIVCWPGCQKDQYPWNWLSLRGWPVLCCTWPSIVFWWPKTISKSNNLLMTPYFWKKLVLGAFCLERYFKVLLGHIWCVAHATTCSVYGNMLVGSG